MAVELYPLTFEPIFKTVVWGGTALRPFFGAPPSEEPTGEAWILSDQGDHPSRVADGPLAGITLRQLLAERPSEILGDDSLSNGRFPLLCKVLEARENLSVQVHPNDEQARRFEPASAGLGKTEAWVILRSQPGSRVYAGLREGIGRREFHEALQHDRLPEVLHSYEPKVGDCIYLDAGTVHAIGAGLVLFEVQQTSDITYRLYDWGRIDFKTGKPRQLHIEQALACTNYERGPCDPTTPKSLPHKKGDLLVECPYFSLERLSSAERFKAGAPNRCTIVACIGGAGRLVWRDGSTEIRAGSIVLLPAAIGQCDVVPQSPITLLQCSP